MPEVIDKVLWQRDTPIPSGETIESGIIDVSGAQHIAVNVSLTRGVVPNVVRRILFGRTGPPEGALMPLHTNTFEAGDLWTLVPVLGPKLEVTMENKGSQPETISFAAVYGVREAP